MRTLPCVAILLASPALIAFAQAQEKPQATATTTRDTELHFKAAPKLGRSLLETDGNQPQNESEFELGMTIVRPMSRDIDIEITPAISYAPLIYANDDPSSQISSGFELSRNLSLGKERRALRYTSVSVLEVTPFVSYTPSLGFDDAFGDHAFFDNVFAGGLRVGNEIWFHCRRPWLVQVGLGCGDKRRLAFAIAIQVQRTISDQADRRRITPRTDAKVVVPVGKLDIRLSSRFESRRFIELRTPTGEKQSDGRISADLSFDFKNFVPGLRKLLFGDESKLSIVNDFTMEIGASYVRNRSNDPTRNFDRIFVVPKFTYTRQLD